MDARILRRLPCLCPCSESEAPQIAFVPKPMLKGTSAHITEVMERAEL